MRSEDAKKRTSFHSRFDNSKTLADIFEVVKAAIWDNQRASRGGLMLGIANLGNHPQGFLGAFYPVGTNVIVIKNLVYPDAAWQPDETKMELVGGFDRESASYIG